MAAILSGLSQPLLAQSGYRGATLLSQNAPDCDGWAFNNEMKTGQRAVNSVTIEQPQDRTWNIEPHDTGLYQT